MKKVLVIGCGFGGVVSAWRLSQFSGKVETTLVDKARSFNFLPLLPDCLGRGIPASALAYPIEKLSARYGFNFVNSRVDSLDLEKRQAYSVHGPIDYDYLIIASGSETNFYGNETIRRYAYKLDDAADAEKLRGALEEKAFATYIIAGGGYTGVEIASNLRLYLNRAGRKDRVIVVERAPTILGALPEWMKAYVLDNLRKSGIEVFNNTVIENVEDRMVSISGRGEFANAMLIWAAGVKTADFLQGIKAEKNPQGRIRVDEFLRLSESCFVVGDAAYFSYGNNFLRMAVQFAIAQGSLAVYNIINTIAGRRLQRYRPFDAGYIIPMANNRSCGKVLGADLRGFLPTAFHYIMSVYRSYGWKNKTGIVKAVMGFK